MNRAQGTGKTDAAAHDTEGRKKVGKQTERAPGRLPEHLPRKLTISFWYHDWLSAALPGAPFEDLDACVAGMKQRGFNTARAGIGLTYAFRLDGRPRGPMLFAPPVPGFARSQVFASHGGRRDAIERLIQLLELARRHGVWIILTSWDMRGCRVERIPFAWRRGQVAAATA